MEKENIMKKNNSTAGIGFFGLLQIAFIVLKLIGVIKWNWIMVFIPSFIYVLLMIIIFVGLIIYSIKVNKMNSKYNKGGQR
jgi:hypothetical protein